MVYAENQSSPLTQGCVTHEGTWRPLKGGEGTGHLLERVLEAWAEECARQVSALQRISLRERDRETERHGDQSSNGAKLFYSTCVGIYTVLQDSYFQQR